MCAFVKLSIYMQQAAFSATVKLAVAAAAGELTATRSPVNSLNEPPCVRFGERPCVVIVRVAYYYVRAVVMQRAGYRAISRK